MKYLWKQLENAREMAQTNDRFYASLIESPRFVLNPTVSFLQQDGMTVLHLAARFGHVDVLEVLRGKVPWSMASVKVRGILNF